MRSELCVVDDERATAGSANLNRRSWTYDSELPAAVVGEGAEGSFARELRIRLWCEHLQRDDADVSDPADGIAGCGASAATEAWAGPAARLLVDPGGRPRSLRRPRIR